jgi:hypothetical protein
LDQGVEAISPAFKDIKNVSSTIGEANGKEFGMYAMFENSTITHQGSVIPIIAIAVFIKVWNNIEEREASNFACYSYSDQRDAVLGELTMAEIKFKDKNLIVGVTNVGKGKRKIGLDLTRDIDKIKLHDMVCLGTIDDLGLRPHLDKTGDSKTE